MEKEIKIRQKIVDELVQWNCIEFNSEIIGITDAIMEIINPLITEFDSKRGPEDEEKQIPLCNDIKLIDGKIY